MTDQQQEAMVYQRELTVLIETAKAQGEVEVSDRLIFAAIMEYTQELRKQLLCLTAEVYESLTPEEREVAERLRIQLEALARPTPIYPLPPQKIMP